ncbi:MAG: hypothetical protein H6Q04_1979, partial [Acidobacteria bacterium]|nr:hypothetical protein [Acidobacteriota bacterium]
GSALSHREGESTGRLSEQHLGRVDFVHITAESIRKVGLLKPFQCVYHVLGAFHVAQVRIAVTHLGICVIQVRVPADGLLELADGLLVIALPAIDLSHSQIPTCLLRRQALDLAVLGLGI